MKILQNPKQDCNRIYNKSLPMRLFIFEKYKFINKKLCYNIM